MALRKTTLLLVLVCCSASLTLAQTVETAKKPPSLLFKNAAGVAVTSIRIPVLNHEPVVEMQVSIPANMTYVLSAEGKSKARSISAVNLSTQKLAKVIDLGDADKVEMLMSLDGRRLFCHTISRAYPEDAHAPLNAQRSRGSSSIVVIDTSSNQIIGKYDLLNSPGEVLPKCWWLQTFFSITADGGRILASVAGLGRRLRPSWTRVLVFSVQSDKPPLIIDPGEPFIVASRFSKDNRFLFLATEDKKRHSEFVDVTDLGKGTTVNRRLDDPPSRDERLSVFLDGAPPSSMGSQDGIWIVTRGGLRFLSQTGNIGDEIQLPREEGVAAALSLDATRFFLAVPDKDHRTGILDIVDLTQGASSSIALTDAPTRLVRLGSGQRLWLMGRKEMRSISEAGELGQPILLNKPRKIEEGDTGAADAFLDGYPGEAISLGEDRAAVLVTNNKGASLHRVALLDLKNLQLYSVVVTMSRGQRAKILAGRIGISLAVAAAEGAAGGALGAAPTLLLPVYVPSLGFANEFLATGPDGAKLYALDTDVHEVTVVDVKTGAAERRIPVAKSVTIIRLARNGRYLVCVGPGFIQEIKLDSNERAKEG